MSHNDNRPMSIAIDVEQMVAALESVRKFICPYVISTNCDCKYGAHSGIAIYPQEGKCIRGEISGCPEIRLIQEFLLAVKEKEFDAIVQRLISSEVNDPGQSLRKVQKIAEKYGAGIKSDPYKMFPELVKAIDEVIDESSSRHDDHNQHTPGNEQETTKNRKPSSTDD